MLRVLHLGPKARHILCRTGFDAPWNLRPEGATHSIGLAAVACQPRLLKLRFLAFETAHFQELRARARAQSKTVLRDRSHRLSRTLLCTERLVFWITPQHFKSQRLFLQLLQSLLDRRSLLVSFQLNKEQILAPATFNWK
jgi:hypothetical protein